jgi:hypothetical protein
MRCEYLNKIQQYQYVYNRLIEQPLFKNVDVSCRQRFVTVFRVLQSTPQIVYFRSVRHLVVKCCNVSHFCYKIVLIDLEVCFLIVFI